MKKRKRRLVRRRKGRQGLGRKTLSKRMKRRTTIVLIRKKGLRRLAVRKVHQLKEREKSQMKTITGTMMTQLHRHHLSSRNSKWRIS